MFGNDRFQAMGVVFGNRFEPDGDGYIFRSKLTSQGVHVTTVEKERFISEYTDKTRILVWSAVAITLVSTCGVFFVEFKFSGGKEFPGWPLFYIIGLFVVLIFSATLWLWKAPDRALQGRPVAASGYSTVDAKRIAFSRLTWRNLLGAAVMMEFAIWRLSHGDFVTGWHKVWLALAVLAVVVVLVQGLRKWRAETVR